MTPTEQPSDATPETPVTPYPAARLSDRHVDDAIAFSEGRERWRQRRASAGRAWGFLRWLSSPLRWFHANAKDIMVTLGAVSVTLGILNTLGIVDLEALPAWFGRIAAAIAAHT